MIDHFSTEPVSYLDYGATEENLDRVGRRPMLERERDERPEEDPVPPAERDA